MRQDSRVAQRMQQPQQQRGEALFNSDQPVGRPSENPSYEGTFTFSARLGNVTIPEITYHRKKQTCDGQEGADGLLIEWDLC